MEIWLNMDNDKLQFPALPETFELTDTMNNTKVTIHSLGEVTLVGKRGLKSIELSSFFPKNDYDFLAYHNFKDPYEYVNKIESWLEKKPHLIITETNINMDVTIESFKYGENEFNGDVSFTITLSEYRKITYTKQKSEPAKKTSKKVKKAATKRKTKTVKTKKYTVKKGDNLWSIAKRFTGKGSNNKAIYNQNKKVIEKAAKKHGKKSSNKGWWIYPGTKLVIKI